MRTAADDNGAAVDGLTIAPRPLAEVREFASEVDHRLTSAAKSPALVLAVIFSKANCTEKSHFRVAIGSQR